MDTSEDETVKKIQYKWNFPPIKFADVIFLLFQFKALPKRLLTAGHGTCWKVE